MKYHAFKEKLFILLNGKVDLAFASVPCRIFPLRPAGSPPPAIMDAAWFGQMRTPDFIETGMAFMNEGHNPFAPILYRRNRHINDLDFIQNPSTLAHLVAALGAPSVQMALLPEALARSPSPSAKDYFWDTTVPHLLVEWSAAEDVQISLLPLYIEAGLDLNIRGRNGRTFPETLAIKGKPAVQKAIFPLMIKAGMDVNTSFINIATGETIAAHIAKTAEADVVKALIPQFVDAGLIVSQKYPKSGLGSRTETLADILEKRPDGKNFKNMISGLRELEKQEEIVYAAFPTEKPHFLDKVLHPLKTLTGAIKHLFIKNDVKHLRDAVETNDLPLLAEIGGTLGTHAAGIAAHFAKKSGRPDAAQVLLGYEPRMLDAGGDPYRSLPPPRT